MAALILSGGAAKGISPEPRLRPALPCQKITPAFVFFETLLGIIDEPAHESSAATIIEAPCWRLADRPDFFTGAGGCRPVAPQDRHDGFGAGNSDEFFPSGDPLREARRHSFRRVFHF